MSGRSLHCSFCGKTEHQVRKLIASPNVFICNDCVTLCNEIIDAEPPKPRFRVRSDGWCMPISGGSPRRKRWAAAEQRA